MPGIRDSITGTELLGAMFSLVFLFPKPVECRFSLQCSPFETLRKFTHKHFTSFPFVVKIKLIHKTIENESENVASFLKGSTSCTASFGCRAAALKKHEARQNASSVDEYQLGGPIE